MKGVYIQKATTCIELYSRFFMYSIEVNNRGRWHYNHDEEAEIYDTKRQKVLEEAGFKVLRFSDGEILNHINGVAEVIEDWIDEWEIVQRSKGSHSQSG